MEKVKIETEYIKLDQFLKFVGCADTGAHAKEMVLSGNIKVNGETEMQRGKKLRSGDIVEAFGQKYEVV